MQVENLDGDYYTNLNTSFNLKDSYLRLKVNLPRRFLKLKLGKDTIREILGFDKNLLSPLEMLARAADMGVNFSITKQTPNHVKRHLDDLANDLESSNIPAYIYVALHTINPLQITFAQGYEPFPLAFTGIKDIEEYYLICQNRTAETVVGVHPGMKDQLIDMGLDYALPLGIDFSVANLEKHPSFLSYKTYKDIHLTQGKDQDSGRALNILLHHIIPLGIDPYLGKHDDIFKFWITRGYLPEFSELHNYVDNIHIAKRLLDFRPELSETMDRFLIFPFLKNDINYLYEENDIGDAMRYIATLAQEDYQQHPEVFDVQIRSHHIYNNLLAKTDLPKYSMSQDERHRLVKGLTDQEIIEKANKNPEVGTVLGIEDYMKYIFRAYVDVDALGNLPWGHMRSLVHLQINRCGNELSLATGLINNPKCISLDRVVGYLNRNVPDPELDAILDRKGLYTLKNLLKKRIPDLYSLVRESIERRLS